jgi:metal-dependent hydrolase (beta-lactamase superfamily II)
MTIHGRKDNDDSQRVSLEKAQANGFGAPGVAGRKKMDSTALFEERAASRMPGIIDGILDAWERGINHPNAKIAADTATKVARIIYNPEQKVVVEGPSHNELNVNLIIDQDKLSAKDKMVLGAFHSIIEQGVRVEEQEVIEAEIVRNSNE